MESLPCGDAAFDAVTGVNAFQFAGDPRRALGEAARATRPGSRVGSRLVAAPGRAGGTGGREASPVRAGRPRDGAGGLVCRWRCADMDEPLRALLCSAGGARAAEAA